MSDILGFNGSSTAGWAQPKPILSASEIESTVPNSMLRNRPPA